MPHEQRSSSFIGAGCDQAMAGLVKWVNAARTEPGSRPGLWHPGEHHGR